MNNYNNLIWWMGVVEDRQDPEQLGRCKVRIFGYHTEDINVLPTEDLPWAMPMQPITSAAISGKGSTPIGPIEGTWVVGWFLDGSDMQQPLMVGTLAGKNKINSYSAKINSDSNEKSGVTRDVFGNVVRGTTGVANNLNYDTTSSISYISSNLPPLKPEQIKLVMDAISGLESSSIANGPIVTEPLSTQQLKERKDKSQFYGAYNRFGYIGKYQFGYAALKQLGYVTAISNDDLNNKEVWTGKDGLKSKEDFFKNPEIQESIMFQYMKYNYELLLKKGVITTEDDPTHVAGILATAHNGGVGRATDFNSTDGNSKKRGDYYTAANRILGGEGAVPNTSSDVNYRQTNLSGNNNNPTDISSRELNNQELLNRKGFVDPNRVYPTNEYSGAPDTNKLARGDKNHPSIDKKELSRVTNVDLANSNRTWSQPSIPYGAAYPYNQVYETEAGHIFEFDSSPGRERINLYHKSGTYFEIDVNGTIIKRNVGNNYEITDKNGFLYVKGAYVLTVDGVTKILVKNNADIEVNGSTNIIGHGDTNLKAANRLNLAADSINISSKTSLNIVSEGPVRMQGSDVHLYAERENLTLKADNKMALHALDSLSLNGGLELKMDATVIKSKMGSTSVQEIKLPIDSLPEKLTPAPFTGENIHIPESDPNSYIFDSTETELTTLRRQRIEEGDVVDLGQKEGKKDSSIPSDKNIISVDCSLFSNYKDVFPDTLQLSKYFQLGTLSTRAAASSFKVVAQKGLTIPEIICNLKHLAVNCLDPIKEKYPDMIITSGFRRGENQEDHGRGMAADLQFTKRNKAEYYEIARWIKSNVPFKQLLLEYLDKGSGEKTSWIHIALDPSGAKSSLQIATFYNHSVYPNGRNTLVNLISSA